MLLRYFCNYFYTCISFHSINFYCHLKFYIFSVTFGCVVFLCLIPIASQSSYLAVCSVFWFLVEVYKLLQILDERFLLWTHSNSQLLIFSSLREKNKLSNFTQRCWKIKLSYTDVFIIMWFIVGVFFLVKMADTRVIIYF